LGQAAEPDIAREIMSEPVVTDAQSEDDAYAMANLRPIRTGLPMVVWVSERGNAQHDVRVKVCCVHGDKIQFHNTVSVAVCPQPHLVPPGRLSTADLDAVRSWIALNADPIIAYWDGIIDTVELLQRLQPL
jgi:hypothetical protein